MNHESVKQHSWTVKLSELFAQWQLEHRDLQVSIDKRRRWMYEVKELGLPRFGETADQLVALRARLVQHFEREDMLGRALLDTEPNAELEITALCRQANHDHELLLSRLDSLVERLRQNEPPFETWKQALNEVELFVDGLEEHEELEAESVKCWLRDH